MRHGCATILERADILAAIRILDAGGVVAIPTDTVYGIAASLLHPAAVERIYAIKGRAPDKPIPVLVSDSTHLDRFGCNVPPAAYALAQRFWPGPLTIVVHASTLTPPVVLSGGTTVGLRMPAGGLPLAIIEAAGGALAVTSANQSGVVEARSADEVREQLGDLVDAIVDGGLSPGDSPSTVVDATLSPVRIVRAGAISPADIRAYLNGPARE